MPAEVERGVAGVDGEDEDVEVGVVDAEGFGADLAVCGKEWWLADGGCDEDVWVLDQSVFVDAVADLGWKGEETR